MPVVSWHLSCGDGAVDSPATYQFPTLLLMGDPHPSCKLHLVPRYSEPTEHHTDGHTNEQWWKQIFFIDQMPCRSIFVPRHRHLRASFVNGCFQFQLARTIEQRMATIVRRQDLSLIHRAAPISFAKCTMNFPRHLEPSLPQMHGKGAPNSVNCTKSSLTVVSTRPLLAQHT